MPRALVSDIVFGESARWHEGRLWFSDWGAREVIAVDLAGNREVIARVPTFPFSIDWLPDGRLLIVSSGLQRMEADGELVGHGDLTHLAAGWNELVVDGRGNAYVNQTGFDLMAGAEPATGTIALVTPDGSAREVADGVWYADVPNRHCVRVAQGGQVLQTVTLDRGCFSCALGGPQGRTLFIAATKWNGPEHMFQGERTGQVVAIDVSIPHAGHP